MNHSYYTRALDRLSLCSLSPPSLIFCKNSCENSELARSRLTKTVNPLPKCCLGGNPPPPIPMSLSTCRASGKASRLDFVNSFTAIRVLARVQRDEIFVITYSNPLHNNGIYTAKPQSRPLEAETTLIFVPTGLHSRYTLSASIGAIS